MGIGDVIRVRRNELGLSQAQLADAADLTTRQIARYESGDSNEPGLRAAIRLADALNISLLELAGQISGHSLDLGGTWWAGWQTQRDGTEWIAVQKVTVHQTGDLLTLMAERTRPVNEGGYSWSGELRLWDSQALIGWYRATDAAVQSKGTMYFALHTQGTKAKGRWVGLSHDGTIITGHSVLARAKDDVEPAIIDLRDRS